ncbi:MAG: hypothetical protein MUC63_03105 [Planctomycetes bacterium]|nr:hypothetical protein [Planctomycetota bacterium]
MNILEKLKSLFSREDIPEEAKSAFSGAKSTSELLGGLDAVATRNEIESNKVKKEIDRVDAVLTEEETKIRGGSLEGRQKKYSLQYIKRLRAHLENLDRRMDIYDKNINLCIQLIGKVQDMEAMALRGVDEPTIDRIIMEFEDQVGKYMDVVNAGEAGFEGASNLSERHDKELDRLERELLGGEGPAREREGEPEERKPEGKKPLKEAPAPKKTEAAPAEPEEDEDDEEETGRPEKQLE